MGMIVPMSIGCTQRMESIMSFFNNEGFYISNFGWRPSKLFEGATQANISLSILLTNKSKKNYTTDYNRWASNYRPFLFENIKYVEFNNQKQNHIFPKLSNKVEKSIYLKVKDLKNIENYCSDKKTENKVYYRTTGGLYWKIFTVFQPIFFKNGVQTSSSRETHLYLKTEKEMYVTFALLWSNFYWWWYIKNSNGRDNNPSDLKSLPMSDKILQDESLYTLGKELDENLIKNAIFKERNHGNDNTKYQTFQPKLSKGVIDKIDILLGDLFGFSEEEKEYIINYDIKYRMGNETEEDED